MKKTSRKSVLLLVLLLTMSFVMQGICVSAAAAKKPDFNVSKDGKKFKVTKGKKSYSFRYDWDSKKQDYTGYDQKEINNVVPFGPMKGVHMAMEHESAKSRQEASIVVLKGVTLNKKIYYGMTLAAFHKNFKKAWGKGAYFYWSNEKKAPVKIGKKKPTNSYVKKRMKDTGLFWAGDRGRLRINCSINWNAKKKRAEVGWIEMWVK